MDVIYKIEKGIEIPSGSGGQKFPFAKMEIGDSFLVPEQDKNRAEKAVNYVYEWARRHGRKHTVRRMDGGFRVWRIS